MIEYLYDAIRVVAGQDLAIRAVIDNDENDEPITENCNLVLHFKDGSMFVAPGLYDPEVNQWTFNVPGTATAGQSGRHQYCLQHDGANLCFKKPMYLLA